jgi:hypothetical protein
MKIKEILLFCLLLISLNTLSHPVIYKDGIVYWGSFAPDMNTQRVSYTLDPKYSVELNTTWFFNVDEYRDYTFGINYLFKRWLNNDSQGNIYGSLHTGYYEDNNGEGLVNHAMLMGDWESRRYYTAGSVMAFSYDGEEKYKYSYRFGVAPYIAGMNTLQAWLIVKLDYFKENNRTILITPMMRFFYKNILWEIGSNTQGDSFLTLMTHY